MSIDITFDKKQFEQFISKSKSIQKQVIKWYLDATTDFLLGKAMDNLTIGETKAFDTGALHSSGVTIVDLENNTGIVGFGGPDTDDYVLPVEFGTEPGHRPPIAPLIAWCRRVGIPKPDKVAWAIAKNIEKNGLRARPFMRNAVESTKKEAQRIWKEANEQFN
ncbi:MAG: hypothetical protein V3V19_11350 [Cocleimonas sp.]